MIADRELDHCANAVVFNKQHCDRWKIKYGEFNYETSLCPTIGEKYTFIDNDIFVRHDDELIFVHGEESLTSKSVTLVLGKNEIVDELYQLMVKLGCINSQIIEDGLPEIFDYGNITWKNVMQRAIVMTAVGVFQHSYGISKISFVQLDEGKYLFTARQWMDNNKEIDYGILSHAMCKWINAIAKFYEKGISPPSLTLDNLSIGIHNRKNNVLVTSLIFDFFNSINVNNNFVRGKEISQSYVHNLREIGFIGLKLALNVGEIKLDQPDGAHQIGELIKNLFKDKWCQNFEPAFLAFFKMLEEAPMYPDPQFFNSLGNCFTPTYVKEALTNGTKNIKELYEFDRIAFDGGYQAQVYRGRDKVSGRPVVLKVSSRVSLRPDYEAYRQIGALDANIINYNIPQLLEYGLREGKEAIVLTDVGENLFELVESKKLNFNLVYPQVMTHLIKALQYMHTHGVCHNDLKPNNIGFGTYRTTYPNTFDHIAVSVEGNAYLLDMGCTSKMPTGKTPNLGKIFTWVRAQKCENLGADTDIFMAGLTWLYTFRKLPWKLDDGNENIIKMKEKFMESDESIKGFIETHYNEFDCVLKSRFIDYFQKIRRVLYDSIELDYDQFLQIFQ